VTLVSAPAAAADKSATEYRLTYETALALFDSKKYDDAIVGFERAYALRPEPDALYMIARAHHAAGHDEKAAGAYDKFLAAAPGHRDVHRARGFLVEVLQRAGEAQLLAKDFAAARATFERALSAHAAAASDTTVPSGALLAGLGDALLGLGLLPDARAAFEKARGTGPPAEVAARIEAGASRAAPPPAPPTSAAPPSATPDPFAAAPSTEPKRSSSRVALFVALGGGVAVLLAAGVALGVVLASRPPHTDLGYMAFPPAALTGARR
jgi:hypothetical protein